MIRGGVADKLGNDYEAHWTLIEALRVLRGHADEIRLEPFNEDGTGFEFRVNSAEGVVWHQCKRRRGGGTWSIATLTSDDVLANFGRKLADPRAGCVFVSSDPAAAFKALVEKARLVESSGDFVASLSSSDHIAKGQVEAVWGADEAIIFDHLKRCRVETVSEYSLRREARAICELTFAAEPDKAIERLAAYLERKITQTITTATFREAINELDIGWKAYLDETLDGKFGRATDEYLASLLAPIAGAVIDTDDISDVVSAAVSGPPHLLVVAGAAGSGKSIAMSRIIEAGRDRGWPTLALRIDRFLSASRIEEVGQALVGRAESPVGVLGNRHGQRETLLVIDQVDAVSEASGRSGRMRDQLFQMIADSAYFPLMRVVFACRSYDLEHDSRLKQFVASPYAKTIELKPLSWEESVKPVLSKLGLGERTFSEREQRLLSTPINLRLFADLYALGEVVEGEISGSRMFDQLLEVRAREFRDAGITWTPQEALGAVAQSMSDHQELVAPASVLAPFAGAKDALSSSSLITAVGGKLQFAHESFFDHVFSTHFVASGKTVRDLLLSDEQRLFRRTQVRQIFARLRDESTSRNYAANLAEVMDAADVRYLVKDAIAHWLRSVDEPTDRERDLVARWFISGHANEGLARTIFSGPNWLPVLLRSRTISGWLEEGEPAKSFGMWLMQRSAEEHSEEIEPFLRAWWGDDPDRLLELVDWFARIFPEAPIGPLEGLYRELISAYPKEKLEAGKFEDSFDLGNWVHKNKGLGARVLGYWLERWMAAFPAAHPFGEYVSGNDEYWVKELAEHEPEAYLEAVWPSFIEALARERLLLDRGELDYPTIRVPMSEHDSRPMWSLLIAIERVSRANPEKAATFLDRLPAIEKPALLLHLRAIAANGAALADRLVPLLGTKGIFDIGDSPGEWAPFALAAKAAFPHLSTAERALVEGAVLAHRPELAWASEFLNRVREGRAVLTSDPHGYVRYQMSISGQDERAILRTIGDQHLSEHASRRLAELDRKFNNAPLPEAYGVRGGWVTSPIDTDKAARMSDTNWLSAFTAYAGEERHHYLKDTVIGGARELASVLRARTKEEPERFVALLERMPPTCSELYVNAVVGGLLDVPANGPLAARAVLAAQNWPDVDLGRSLSWTVQRHPEAAKNPAVLELVLREAESGEASDPDEPTAEDGDKPATFRELLRRTRGFESSGMNGNRGAAFEALASILWNDVDILGQVVDLVERRIELEPLTSVRMMMLHAINSISKHELSKGLELLERLARKDPTALHCNNGHHILNWATYNPLFDADGISRLLCSSGDLPLRSLGLLMQTGLAIGDDDRFNAFQASFEGDPLRRQAAAYRASGNVTSDRVGDRAVMWMSLLLDDDEPTVRREAAHTAWEAVLDGKTDRSPLVLKHIESRSFADESDGLMRALEDRVDQHPDVAFRAAMRVVELMDGWQGPERQGHWATLHHLGRMLVRLYRAVDGDSEREAELLDLFDVYLAREPGEMRSEISAYERH